MHPAPRTALALLLVAEAVSCSGGREQPPPIHVVDGEPDAGVPPVVKPPQVPVSPLFIGTGGFAYAFGSAFPGAAAPQGLAKVGPDTKGPWGTIGFLHFSGYWYGDDTILTGSPDHACCSGHRGLLVRVALRAPRRPVPVPSGAHGAPGQVRPPDRVGA